MRGIAAFTQLHSQPPDVTELMRSRTSPLTPREPDGEGFHVAPRIALDHRRLSDLTPLFRTFDMSSATLSQRSSHARKRQGEAWAGAEFPSPL